MIEIDGSQGEGGGQVLRSALTLSLLTRTPLRVVRIRARRPEPGLMPQHLEAVAAAARIGNARVSGAALGSQALTFEPGAIEGGDFRFSIGTAGSIALVLQTIAVPLCVARTASRASICGGTHVRWSPCFDYLELHWRRFMHAIGFTIELRQEYAGFYPKGGGIVHAAFAPCGELRALDVTARGALRAVHGVSAVAQLDRRIAERQKAQVLRRLAGWDAEIEITASEMRAHSPGTVVLLRAEFERGQCCFYALGARGKAAERVADEAVAQLAAFLATDAAIDRYLADQLVLPLACVAGTSRLRTEITSHLVTNARIVEAFLPVAVTIDAALGRTGVVRISGPGLAARYQGISLPS